MKIKGLTEETQTKLEKCCQKIINILDKDFPEFRELWNKHDPGAFEDRVFMTMYLELIHSGFFKND